MLKRFIAGISCIIFLSMLLCGCQSAVPTTTAQVQKYPFQDATLPVEERIKDLLGRMTPQEKIGQMVQAERGSAVPAVVAKYTLGSVLSGGGSVPQQGMQQDWQKMTRDYQDEALQCRLPIPLLYGVDAVHGHNNVVGAVLFPQNIGIGAANSPGLTEQMGEAVAAEMIATGVSWDFAPCVAAAQDPRWGRTYESFSSDPALISSLALPFSQGLMKGGVIPTAKHYLADGGTIWGSSKHPGYSIDQGDAAIDEQTLRAVHLPQYEALIKAGVPIVMASFSSWNGVKMTGNKYLLTDVLKGELGFSGFVVSDWQALQQLDGASYEDNVATAVNSGIDMLMEADMWQKAYDAILKDVSDGKITQARIDDAVSRILRVKFQSGLFENPYLANEPSSDFATPAHKALAAELVSRSLVLLKNQNSALPFKKGEKILVIGPAADDLGVQCGGWSLTWQGWSGDNTRTQGTTILAGLQQAALKTGAEILTNQADTAKADVILLVLGEEPYAEGMGDSADISLTGTQALTGNRLAMNFTKASGKPVVTLIVAGRQPVITDEIAGWDAAVMAYLPGTEGEGVAPVLFGDRDFMGKLPMPWYKSVNDIGKADAALLFPLGYGLTYK